MCLGEDEWEKVVANQEFKEFHTPQLASICSITRNIMEDIFKTVYPSLFYLFFCVSKHTEAN